MTRALCMTDASRTARGNRWTNAARAVATVVNPPGDHGRFWNSSAGAEGSCGVEVLARAVRGEWHLRTGHNHRSLECVQVP
jgi:hypothetical protein